MRPRDTERASPSRHPTRADRQPAAGARLLLIEHGIHLMESLDLEALARDRVYEFLFVALPLKIRGATGSMVDPLAVI